MKMSRMIFIAVVIAVIILVAGGCAPKKAEAETVPRYEYKYEVSGYKVIEFTPESNNDYVCIATYYFVDQHSLQCIPKKGVK